MPPLARAAVRAHTPRFWEHRQWYYFFLTDEGIDFLRSYLHLPSEIVPATLKKQARAARPPTAYQGERRGALLLAAMHAP